MRNTKKKGFTIVELVVVVAVIAILAAVLIPTFSGIIKKAKLNADEQTVTNMNKYVAAAAAEEEFAYPADAVNALYDNGFNIGKFETFSKGYHYAYDFEDNKFYLLDDNANVIFPDKDQAASELWGFFNNAKSDYIAGVTKYIATSAVYDANLFNAYDCVFRSETEAYTLDLNSKSLTVAAKGTAKNITLKNGTVLDTVADGYTLDASVEKKAAASAADIAAAAVVNDVMTIEGKIFTQTNITDQLDFSDFGAAKQVVFNDCTFDLSGKNASVEFNGANIESYTFTNCVFNLDAKNVFIIGNTNAPDLTVKDCFFSSGRGLVIGANQIASDISTFDEVLIEGNTFVDNGTASGKPSLQISAGSDCEHKFTASKITIKNNDFNCKDIAVRIHETVSSIVCANVTISGNKIEAKTVIDGDGATKAQAIADSWAPKFN